MAEPTTSQSTTAAVWLGRPDLVDAAATAKLTFNWLKGGPSKKPPPPKGDVEMPQAMLVILMTLVVPALMAGAMCLFIDYWNAVAIALIFALVTSLLMWIYLGLRTGSGPGPDQDHGAPDLKAWKEMRTKPEFWAAMAASNDRDAFIRECAELMAWMHQTRNVAIAKRGNGYGVNVFASRGTLRFVARCFLSYAGPSIGLVRDFAGAKCFFHATAGSLFSYKSVADGSRPVNDFGAALSLSYIDAEGLVLLAKRAIAAPAPAVH